MAEENLRHDDWMRRLVEVGIALSAERDRDTLLEQILLEAKSICNADGGTIYLRDGRDGLRFAIMRSDSLKIALGGTTGEAIPFPPVPLHDPETRQANLSNVAAFVALKGESVNIADAYASENFDFSGTKAYDARTGYRSTSFLTVPLKNTADEVIGVLQLINAIATDKSAVIPFAEELRPVIEALASQAAVAIDNHNLIDAQRKLLDSFRALVEIGIALSAERDHNRLLETILKQAKAMANADGGTLYLREETDELAFAIMRNDTMKIALGGTTGEAIPYPPLPLRDPESGEPNLRNVATFVALKGITVNIPDAYDSTEFDFTGTKAFDARSGYRSRSFLTVPLKNYQNDVVGVLQLINANDAATGDVIPFSDAVQPSIEALSSQAAIAIDNYRLIEAQRLLLESFIRTIAKAIDMKSPYTGGHCQRVPALAQMIANAACAATTGPFASFALSDEEMYELEIASWMHDCGKVTTPEYVVDKATKLETIYDRVETVRTRFEVAKRDAEIEYLTALNAGTGDAAELKAAFEERTSRIDDDRRFVEEANIGGEFMDQEKIDRVHAIAKGTWRDWNGETKPLLSENETYNLCIKRGTLTPEEREVINHHIVATIEMLEELPFPKHLRRVPEYAGGHHEKMDGTGYPRGLTADQMSVPARMMAIADVFEALTAADRPYKSAKTLSESVRIMSFMARDQHLDRDLFELFLESGVHEEYGKKYLLPEQLDIVDIARYLGNP